MRRILIALIGAALGTAAASAHEPDANRAAANALAPSARQPAAVVDAFHAALGRGDTRAAAALLADDALIFESGGVERTKAEYVAHHLPADAAFSKVVSLVITRRAGNSNGALAWVASEGRTTGTYKGRALDLVTTETMILRRTGKNWKIVHIHWSSGTAR
jgi:ketosteroid isomerase-like protein